MITYDEAKAKAIKYDSSVNAVTEFSDAWIFYNSKAKGAEQEDNGIAIMKSSGNAVSVAEYMPMSKGNGKKVKF